MILVIGLILMAALVIGGIVGMPIWAWLAILVAAIAFGAIVKAVNGAPQK